MHSKVKVFVSHSFDEDDRDDIERILTILRTPAYHLDVITARRAEPRRIGDKIERCIDSSDVTFGIFTKRYRDEESDFWVPPPYVISECAFAKGRYGSDEHKGVHGLVEQGVRHPDLGLIAISGEEFPTFTRKQLRAGDTDGIKRFVASLHQRYGPTALKAPKRPYRQQEVRKTVEVLRNGAALFKHTVTIGVFDPGPLTRGGIVHELWATRRATTLSSLKDMAQTPLVQHQQRGSFSCFCVKKNGQNASEPMHVEAIAQNSKSIKFRVRFPFEPKSGDVLCYQYVWSLPNAFAVYEEDLTSGQYNEVSLRTPHGPIRNAVLKIKFEREIVHGAAPELFSKKPFLLYSYTQNEDGFAVDDPSSLPLVEYDARWEIYEAQIPNLHNAVLVRWQPSSHDALRARLRSIKPSTIKAKLSHKLAANAVGRPRRSG